MAWIDKDYLQSNVGIHRGEIRGRRKEEQIAYAKYYEDVDRACTVCGKPSLYKVRLLVHHRPVVEGRCKVHRVASQY